MKQNTLHPNTGNNYGKNNAGKEYNKILIETNGYANDDHAELTKVIVHRNNDMKITCVSSYYSDGVINDGTTLPTKIARIISRWCSNTFNYYRNNDFVMSDTTYNKYYKEDKIITKKMEG